MAHIIFQSVTKKHFNKLIFNVARSISIDQQGLNKNLEQKDPTMFEIIKGEQIRQKQGIDLIASENHCSRSTLDALGSCMSFKYSEGYPGVRNHSGTQFVDKIELLCQKRALEAFSLDQSKWGVNVQAYSGAPANFWVYSGILKPHDRIMSLDLPHGGHLSHGYQTKTKKVSAVSSYFEILPYRLNEKTGLINYDKMEEFARIYQPKLIIAGASAYARLIDYEKIKKLCNEIGCYLLADMAHISGLVAAKVIPSPFDYADIVTTTTHKTLRGPRGALIFYRIGQQGVTDKGQPIHYDLQKRIDAALYPGHQSGPQNHTIAAIAVTLKQACSQEFKLYQEQVLKNAKELAKSLLDKQYNLVSGGTDNHLVLLDLRSKNLDGARMESLLEAVNIYTNKNTVPGDKSALVPSGLRLGAPAMTSRGLNDKDFNEIVNFIDRSVIIANNVKKEAGKRVADFKAWIKKNQEQHPEIIQLRKDVISFSEQFPVPAIDN